MCHQNAGLFQALRLWGLRHKKDASRKNSEEEEGGRKHAHSTF